MISRILGLFVALFTVCATVMAQVPDAMRFQTVIRDSKGQLLKNQEIGMRITLIEKGLSEGDLYAETFKTETSAEGIATVEFGRGTVLEGTRYSSLESVDWTIRKREMTSIWMKIEIDPTGGEDYTIISGESELLTAPYAMYAQQAHYADAARYAQDVAQVGDIQMGEVMVVIEAGEGATIPTVTISGKEVKNGESIRVMSYMPIYVTVDYPENVNYGESRKYYYYGGYVEFNGKDIPQPIYGVTLDYLKLQVSPIQEVLNARAPLHATFGYLDRTGSHFPMVDGYNQAVLGDNSIYRFGYIGPDGEIVGGATNFGSHGGVEDAYTNLNVNGEDIHSLSIGGYGKDVTNVMVGPVLPGTNVLKIKIQRMDEVM